MMLRRPVECTGGSVTFPGLSRLSALPATHTARMLAMFQALAGQFYVAAVVALFVGMYSSQPRE